MSIMSGGQEFNHKDPYTLQTSNKRLPKDPSIKPLLSCYNVLKNVRSLSGKYELTVKKN